VTRNGQRRRWPTSTRLSSTSSGLRLRTTSRRSTPTAMVLSWTRTFLSSISTDRTIRGRGCSSGSQRISSQAVSSPNRSRGNSSPRTPLSAVARRTRCFPSSSTTLTRTESSETSSRPTGRARGMVQSPSRRSCSRRMTGTRSRSTGLG